jgi:redox-sensitive bicupin YhaK (pirin superfamily)
MRSMHNTQTLAPKQHDLGGGFVVRRLLPSVQRQAVGPFVFFDHFGPVTSQPGDNHDVRPHPHIGLATVTYLFEGVMEHRDSTGAVQRIEPGSLNWMTAGRGIVHSERAPADVRQVARTSHGLQLWMALPAEEEECAPAFAHFSAAQIPQCVQHGAHITVLAGKAFGMTSPAPAKSPTVYLDLQLSPGANVPLAVDYAERAVYALDAGCTLDGAALPQHHMVVLAPGSTPRLAAATAARVVLVGGAPLGHRFIAWNFVSSRKERIVQAREDWIAQRFDAVPGETEFIPYPAPNPASKP